MPDLNEPMAVPSASVDFGNYTSPAAIAACQDPLKKISMAMLAYGAAQTESLNQQVTAIRIATESLSQYNEEMKILNTAAAAASAANGADSSMWAVGRFNRFFGGDQDAADLKAKLIADTGLKDADISLVSDGFFVEVRISKANIAAATKNLQLATDKLSSEVQQQQVLMQSATGKYNQTIDVGSGALKTRGTINDNTNQNIR